MLNANKKTPRKIILLEMNKSRDARVYIELSRLKPEFASFRVVIVSDADGLLVESQ